MSAAHVAYEPDPELGLVPEAKGREQVLEELLLVADRRVAQGTDAGDTLVAVADVDMRRQAPDEDPIAAPAVRRLVALAEDDRGLCGLGATLHVVPVVRLGEARVVVELGDLLLA